ncbi:MAG: hypothetical protein WC401_08610 [Bacteroidales bacterium]|jgi:hypothetical protein
MAKYNKFYIEKYKAIKDSCVSVLNEPVPLIGVNESGKSSALEAVARFDYRNDTIADQKKWKFFNRYMPNEKIFSVKADIAIDSVNDIESIIESYAQPEKEEIMAAIGSGADNNSAGSEHAVAAVLHGLRSEQTRFGIYLLWSFAGHNSRIFSFVLASA